MKLYYSPGACSLATHIMLKELGVKADYEAVDLHTHKTKSGKDFYEVNPKGYVPALIREKGGTLTESTAILYYLSEHKPAPGVDRIKLIEWLGFLATEVHKCFGPMFDPTTPHATVSALKEKLRDRFVIIERELGDKPFLLGKDFSGADAYLFTLLSWSGKLGVDISPYKNINDFMKRVESRTAVKEAMKEEGLVAKQ